MLVLNRIDIRWGNERVLRRTSLAADSPGILFLVGSGGTGKSSLLQALSGQRAGCISLHGMAMLQGVDIDARMERIWLPQQLSLCPAADDIGSALQQAGPLPYADISAWLRSSGLHGQIPDLDSPVDALDYQTRRLLAILVRLQSPAALYLVDEPFVGLSPEGRLLVRQRLQQLARSAMVVCATHNRQDCLALGGWTALLAGGAVQECRPTDVFFARPRSHAGKRYVATGGCSMPNKRSVTCTDGIWWQVPGLMAGMSRPGLMADASLQYAQLHEQGVRWLVCLEEEVSGSRQLVRHAGLGHYHLPIIDMAAPGIAEAIRVCELLEPVVSRGDGVAFHCRGGVGRTGTMLAAMLIWFGESASAAIARIRERNPFAIQSMAQLSFLHEFASCAACRRFAELPCPIGESDVA